MFKCQIYAIRAWKRVQNSKREKSSSPTSFSPLPPHYLILFSLQGQTLISSISCIPSQVQHLHRFSVLSVSIDLSPPQWKTKTHPDNSLISFVPTHPSITKPRKLISKEIAHLHAPLHASPPQQYSTLIPSA